MTYRIFIIVFGILIWTLLAATPASAQVDQRCFSEQQCVKQRGGEVGEKDGFHQSLETRKICGGLMNPEGEKLGFCLPIGQATTVVKIGGKSSFTNLGDYIQTIYRYGVALTGLLAVIMIITAGLLWASSGGNTAIIESAKKRLAGALLGLVLVMLSYAILNNINPYLVNLRLPQVWLINQQTVAPQYCDQLKDTKVSVSLGGPYNKKPKDTRCGNDYYVADSGGRKCTSLECPDKQICVSEGKQRSCTAGMLTGVVRADPVLLTDNLVGNIIDNDLKLIAFCANGDLEEIDDIDVSVEGKEEVPEKDYDQRYVFSHSTEIETVCSTKEGLVGFYLGAEINDEGSGIFGPFTPNDLSSGIDDWHAIGKNSPNSHACNTNLALVANQALGRSIQNCEGDTGQDFCSCAAISDEDILQRLSGNKTFTEHLITLAELQAGFVCDITISRTDFPAIDDDNLIDVVENDTDCFENQNSVDF